MREERAARRQEPSGPGRHPARDRKYTAAQQGGARRAPSNPTSPALRASAKALAEVHLGTFVGEPKATDWF